MEEAIVVDKYISCKHKVVATWAFSLRRKLTFLLLLLVVALQSSYTRLYHSLPCLS